jgi:integrase
MARCKDLWFDKKRRKTARHPDRGGNKNAKRWLAIWITPDGREASKAFTTQDAAKKYAGKQESDAERGEYVDPKAGREKFDAVATTHLRLLKVGAGTRRRYESVYRNHIKDQFGERTVKSIKPSEIKEWLNGPLAKLSSSMQEAAYLIACGTFDLAVADGMCRGNPARSPIIPRPRAEGMARKPWDRAKVWQVIDEHPGEYRAIPIAAAGLGLRQGCAFALAEEDIDFDAGKVRIRRQLSRQHGAMTFKAPKGGKERTVPLSRGLAQVLEAQIAAYPPQPYTLPWLGEDGELHGEHTCRILFRWHGDDPRTHGKHVVSSSYDQSVWRPALSRLGITPPPEKDARGILRYRGGDRADGMHALRHFYSTALLDAGVSLAGVMEFMGHSRKGKPITLGVYGHVTEETFDQARAAIDRTLFRLHSVGTVTELRAAR